MKRPPVLDERGVFSTSMVGALLVAGFFRDAIYQGNLAFDHGVGFDVVTDLDILESAQTDTTFHTGLDGFDFVLNAAQ